MQNKIVRMIYGADPRQVVNLLCNELGILKHKKISSIWLLDLCSVMILRGWQIFSLDLYQKWWIPLVSYEKAQPFSYPLYQDRPRKNQVLDASPDSKVHGANMGPIWGRQGPGGPHVGPWTLLSGRVLWFGTCCLNMPLTAIYLVKNHYCLAHSMIQVFSLADIHKLTTLYIVLYFILYHLLIWQLLVQVFHERFARGTHLGEV